MTGLHTKNYKLEFVNEDITDLKVDAIVSSIHRSKQMTSCCLSSRVRQKAGSSVQEELNRMKGELWFGQVVSTAPGQLKTRVRSILFVCLLAWREGNDEAIKSVVYECLELASSKNYTSIAFPALGTGGFKYPQHKVALAMCKGVVEYFVMNPDTSLKHVKVALPLSDKTQLKSVQCFLQTAVAFLEGVNFIDPDQSKLTSVSINGVGAFNGLEGQRVQTSERRQTQLPSLPSVTTALVNTCADTMTGMPGAVFSLAGSPMSGISWSVSPSFDLKQGAFMVTATGKVQIGPFLKSLLFGGKS
ncbi:uncharacterized protein TM_0508-like [Physella acuta]|uniref:uncharacterized protein TM_0508-like n=1 Tax=Physella acuta TaxID=109671 RepID=UPI0027DE5DF3|nr:uncharacterized protein TM_0508-like [Physella acuta]